MSPAGDARSVEINESVTLAQQGDRDAFERLYREHVGKIYGLCLRLTGDVTRAEEATQDAFVRAWSKLSQYRGESSFGSWLYRLATNVVFMGHRSRRRRESRIHAVPDLTVVEGASEPPSSGHGDPHSRAAALDLERALSALPGQARAVFVLHDVEGYRHGEIAEQMGIAVGTSKAHLHRARRLLQRALEGEP